MKKQLKIGVVVVSYNRLSCLKSALTSFDAQTFNPDFILVVDNASADGTKEYLDAWTREASAPCNRYVLHEEENLGGSGGFSDGIKRALELNPDWIWLSDDDAYPDKDALEHVYRYISSSADNELVAVCGAVLNKGAVDTGHRRRTTVKRLKVCENQVPASEYKSHFELNTFSFVGAVISCNAIRKVGLPQSDYFIWYDDTEYSLRLSKVGRIVCCPEIRVVHDASETDDVFTWKGYYGQRNCLDMIRRHFPYYVYLYARLRAVVKARRIARERGSAVGQMYREAISDQRAGRFGIHDTYRPGWRPSN